MTKVKRLGHATFETRDLDRAVDYYTSVVGLSVVSRDANAACLGSRMGLLAVVLEKSTRDHCARLAFEVSPDLDFTTGARRLFEHGLQCKVSSDPLPGVTRLLSFKDPKDTTIELFTGWDFLDSAGKENGVGAYKLGHVAFFCADPRAMVDFYAKVMGFRLSDWIGDYFAFMRCGIDHHGVNFMRGTSNQMQHIAFELRDSIHLTRACDLLGREKKEILWGPVRHGPGHNIATYHRNPDDQIVELFCDMDIMSDEELEIFEPRPWHRDKPQKPRVWDPAAQRDIWGLPNSPEFRRPTGQPKAA